jgi:predicted nucleotidyltransferase
MMFGLPETVLKLLQEYFLTHPQVIKVIVYGSRAMGREKPGSDVDLAIVTTSEQDISAHVEAELEELPTPYLFDVIDYRCITHDPLREDIDRAGKILFEKTKNPRVIL